MSHNNGILFNGVLRPKLLNNAFAFCSFINLHFLLLHTAHFGNNIVLPFLVFNTFQSTFSGFFSTLNNMLTCFIMRSIWKLISFKLLFLLESFLKKS